MVVPITIAKTTAYVRTAFSRTCRIISNFGLLIDLCRPSERPVLRNGWSASTLLAGVHAMDLQVIKRELPDSRGFGEVV